VGDGKSRPRLKKRVPFLGGGNSSIDDVFAIYNGGPVLVS